MVSVDLSDFAKAAASGDSTGKTDALAHLKGDLATEQTSLLTGLDGSASPSSSTDIGDQLLSTLYGSSSMSSLAASGSHANTRAWSLTFHP